MVATATDYLPEAVGGYLRLPRDWANSRPIEGGKTALMLLVDQLELLASTMTKMFDAANRADAEALIAHGRFLEAKFGQSSAGGAGQSGLGPDCKARLGSPGPDRPARHPGRPHHHRRPDPPSTWSDPTDEPPWLTLRPSRPPSRRSARQPSPPGVDPDVARAEGEAPRGHRLRAGRGAHLDWSAQTSGQEMTGGVPRTSSTPPRAAGASASGPTPSVAALALARHPEALAYATALSEVCTAAATLGTPDPAGDGQRLDGRGRPAGRRTCPRRAVAAGAAAT